MRLAFRQTHLYRLVNMELLGGFEPPASSLPGDKMPSSRCGIRLCGRFCPKKNEVGNALLHVFRPLVSLCGKMWVKAFMTQRKGGLLTEAVRAADPVSLIGYAGDLFDECLFSQCCAGPAYIVGHIYKQK